MCVVIQNKTQYSFHDTLRFIIHYFFTIYMYMTLKKTLEQSYKPKSLYPISSKWEVNFLRCRLVFIISVYAIIVFFCIVQLNAFF